MNRTSRREYNKKVMDRKKKVTIIKGSLGIAAFLMLASIVGNIDSNTYKGIHSTTGIVSDSGDIQAENGNIYKVTGFKSGSKVTVKLDGQGNILSITTK